MVTKEGEGEEPEVLSAPDDDDESAEGGIDPDREPAPPIESRFLYVDVAAQRAKQLRRGALPRLPELAPDPETGVRPVPENKLERIAMREVDEGKVYYEVPEKKPVTEEAS